MKRTLAALLGAMCVVVGIGAVAPAAADTARCVTRSEFRQIEDGMTRARVHNIFDIRGTRHHAYDPFEVRSYRTCPNLRNRVVSVSYRPNRHVVNKTYGHFQV